MSLQDRECIKCGLTMFCTRVEIRAHYDSHFLRKRPARNLIVEYELIVASTGPNNVRRCDGTLENSRRLLLKTSRQPCMELCSFCEQGLLDLGFIPNGATLPWPPLSDAQKSECKRRRVSPEERRDQQLWERGLLDASPQLQ